MIYGIFLDLGILEDAGAEGFEAWRFVQKPCLRDEMNPERVRV